MRRLKDFWTPAMLQTFENLHGQGAPTTHQNCMAAFGVARPGKTARDQRARNAPSKAKGSLSES